MNFLETLKQNPQAMKQNMGEKLSFIDGSLNFIFNPQISLQN